jgi:hypothetical protein
LGVGREREREGGLKEMQSIVATDNNLPKVGFIYVEGRS